MPSIAAPEVIRPAFLWVPPSAVGSLGDEVAELAISLGQQVGPEERIALGALTPIKADGMPAGLEAGIVCGRRQIKSWALEMCLIHDAFVTKVHRCVWSAHLTETSDDNFEHVSDLIESYDWLRKRVRRIYRGNGDHRIMLANGGRIEFKARESGKTGRGRDVNRLTLDEWLFGTSAMLGAQVSMLGAVKDRYIRFGSSPGMLRSEPLRMLRDRGRRGGDPSLSWCEWTSERMVNGKRVLPACQDPECTHVARTVTGCFLDDPRVRREVNPAYGRRLSEEFVGQERLAMPPAEYARERCGVWEDPIGETGEILFPKWAERRATLAGPADGDRVAFGADQSWDRSTSWICAAWLGPSGVRVQLVASGPGASWIKSWLLLAPDQEKPRVERYATAAVAMQASGAPISTLHDDLKATAPEDFQEKVLKGMTAAELARACGLVYDLIKDGGIEIAPHAALDTAADGGVAKPMGDSWVIDRARSQADASPLIALIAAVASLLWSVEQPAEQPPNVW